MKAHTLAGVFALCVCWGCPRGAELETESSGSKSVYAAAVDGGPMDVQASPPSDAGTHREALPPTVQFTHHMEGDQIVVEIEHSGPHSGYTCGGDENRLEKREGNTWVPALDERPLYYDNPGYYLDGEFVPPSMTQGGRVWSCVAQPAGKSVVIFPAYEYVKTGQEAPPPDAEGSPAEVDVIERQPLSGQARVTIRYFADTECAAASSHIIELTIPAPEDGV